MLKQQLLSEENLVFVAVDAKNERQLLSEEYLIFIAVDAKAEQQLLSEEILVLLQLMLKMSDSYYQKIILFLLQLMLKLSNSYYQKKIKIESRGPRKFLQNRCKLISILKQIPCKERKKEKGATQFDLDFWWFGHAYSFCFFL